MSYEFRHSICNEVFEKRPFAETCKAIRGAGYAGIEISPFTLSDDPASIPAATRRQHHGTIESEGLRFAGLHWLLAAPKGLHVTTSDKGTRERSWQYIHELIDLCADLGSSGVMVFGSPKQRCTTPGVSRAEATRYYTDGLARVAPHAAERGVTILVEALPRRDCDVVNSLDEAVRIVQQINSPGVQTMFDTHNAIEEAEKHATLVDRHFDFIRHVHINEMDGRHPGTGNYDFKPVFDVLRRRDFKGWVSLEVFDFSLGADKIANDSLRFVEGEISKLG